MKKRHLGFLDLPAKIESGVTATCIRVTALQKYYGFIMDLIAIFYFCSFVSLFL